jgi:hypothetical protein
LKYLFIKEINFSPKTAPDKKSFDEADRKPGDISRTNAAISI